MNSGADVSRGFAVDPSAALEIAFGNILIERMTDVPIINPAIRVEAVGFEPTSAGWLGVMVTPWFMNLMLVPIAGQAWQPLPVGHKRRVSLPAGQFEFFGGCEDEIGEYLYCSMYSPMGQFSDHDSARATAREMCRLLFDKTTADKVREMNPSGLQWFETKKSESSGVSACRRALLRGRPETAGE